MNCSYNTYIVDDGFEGTAEEVAKYLGVTSAMIYSAERENRKAKGHHIKLGRYGRNKETEYEVYDGEEKIFAGTGREIAKKFSVTSYAVRGASWRPNAKLLWKYTIKKISNLGGKHESTIKN